MIVYKEFEPGEILGEFIKCFWVLERTYDAETPCETILPDSYIELIMNFGAPYYLETPGDLPSEFMVGLLKKPLPVYADGTIKILCARFYPWGLLSFFDTDLTQNINTTYVLDLQEKKKTKLRTLVDGGDFDSAIAEFREVFLDLLVHASFDKDTVNAASQILYREKGECRIEDIARMCFTTQRTLERNFSNRLGVSPKSYASNVRFDKVKKALSHDPSANLTALAHDAGYHDQAHFIKDFKSYCGCTPSDFAGGIKRMSQTFADRENVVFLQSRK